MTAAEDPAQADSEKMLKTFLCRVLTAAAPGLEWLRHWLMRWGGALFDGLGLRSSIWRDWANYFVAETQTQTMFELLQDTQIESVQDTQIMFESLQDTQTESLQDTQIMFEPLENTQSMTESPEDAPELTLEFAADSQETQEDPGYLMQTLEIQASQADAEESLDDAEEIQADAEESLGDAEEIHADAEESLGDAEEIHADAEESLGDAEEIQADAEEGKTQQQGPPTLIEFSIRNATLTLQRLIHQQVMSDKGEPLGLFKPDNEPYFTDAQQCTNLCLLTSKLESGTPMEIPLEQPRAAMLFILAHSIVSRPDLHLIQVDHEPNAVAYASSACSFFHAFEQFAKCATKSVAVLDYAGKPEVAALWPAYIAFRQAYLEWEQGILASERRKVKFSLKCLYAAYPHLVQISNHPFFFKDLNQEIRLQEAKFVEVSTQSEFETFKVVYQRPNLRMAQECNQENWVDYKVRLYYDLLVHGNGFTYEKLWRFHDLVGNCLQSPFNMAFSRSAEEVFVDMVETHGFHLQDILLIFKDCLIASISNIAKATPAHLLNSFKDSVRSLDLHHLIETDQANFVHLWRFARRIVEAAAVSFRVSDKLLYHARYRLSVLLDSDPRLVSLRDYVNVTVGLVLAVIDISDDPNKELHNHNVSLLSAEDDLLKECCIQVYTSSYLSDTTKKSFQRTFSAFAYAAACLHAETPEIFHPHPCDLQAITEAVRRRLLLDLTTSDTFPDTDYTIGPLPHYPEQDRVDAAMSCAIQAAARTSKESRVAALVVLRKKLAKLQDPADKKRVNSQIAVLQTTLKIQALSKAHLRLLQNLYPQDPVQSVRENQRPTKAMVVGYPEFYQIEREFLMAIRNIFRASLTIASCLRCLGAYSERAQFAYVAAVAESVDLPWQDYDPSKIYIGDAESRFLGSAYAFNPKIRIASDPAAHFKLFQVAQTLLRAMHWQPSMIASVMPEDTRNVRDLWLSEISDEEFDVTNSAIVRLLQAFTGPLRKISKLDKKLKSAVYEQIVLHALPSVLTTEVFSCA